MRGVCSGEHPSGQTGFLSGFLNTELFIAGPLEIKSLPVFFMISFLQLSSFPLFWSRFSHLTSAYANSTCKIDIIMGLYEFSEVRRRHHPHLCLECRF